MTQRILEIKRKTLLKYSRKDTPERVDRSRELKYEFTNFDESSLEKDYTANFLGRVTGGDEAHYTRVSIQQILENVRFFLLKHDKQISDLTNADAVSILAQSVKENDLNVHCDCGDFKYRFSYSATIKGYDLRDYKELRPARQTNPHNKGALCKHLITTFRQNTFIRRGAAQFLRELKNNESKYLDLMNLENLD